MMSAKVYQVLIASALLIRCSLTSSPVVENRAYGNPMYISSDMQCLAQMPYVDLLKIQKAIKMMHAVSAYDVNRLSNLTASHFDGQNYNQSDSSVMREPPSDETRNIFRFLPRFGHSTTKSPLAEPFMMTSQLHDAMTNDGMIHKTGYGSEWEEEKPSKVQKVLHVSITALAFLAFAGYLLCMIVQAIKSKGTTYFHNPNLALMTVDAVTTKRVTGIRPNRFRRNAKTVERIIIAEPDPQSLFNVLVAVSKGYVQLSHLIQPPH